MKKYLFVILGAIILIGCKSEQEKALEAAIKTQQLSVLREFAVTYPDSIMETQVKADFKVALEALIKDSTYYEMATTGSNALIKNNAATAYVNELPDGLHVKEMQVIISETQGITEQLKAKINELRNVFEQYKFVENDDDDGTYTYNFQTPDDYGQGEVLIKASPIDAKIWYDPVDIFSERYYRLGRVSRSCTGIYYINDDLNVVLEVDEKRTYGRHPYANEYGSASIKELVADLKYHYPTPPHRKLILTYSDNGFPHFTANDKNGWTIRISAKVK